MVEVFFFFFFRTYLCELVFSALVKTRKQVKYRTELQATSFNYKPNNGDSVLAKHIIYFNKLMLI